MANLQPSIQPGRIHFHIRWYRAERVDWEPFVTRAEAEARARELVCGGETFAVEEFDESCCQVICSADRFARLREK